MSKLNSSQLNPAFRNYKEVEKIVEKRNKKGGYDQPSKKQVEESKFRRKVDLILDDKRMKENDLL